MNINKVTSAFSMDEGILLFALVLFINLLQSFFTPLMNDEAYYWLYALYPAWGYFDHPPMVAFLINAGSAIFQNEIGVRLIGALMGSATFFLVYKIIEGESESPVNFKLAALLLLSSLFLNLYSFMALPDTPMLFFAALFLFVYRRYIKNFSIVNALLLGCIAALLLYSKYHGILLIGFTLLSNPKLFLKRSFYIIPAIALVLYAPHIYWEIKNDFPTIRFQFFERTNAFSLQHVFSYIGEQAAVTGPAILLLFAILYRPKNQFQKTLKYNVTGVFLFFFLSSLKEMVNLHWTAIAWPGMLCLAYLYIAELTTKRWVFGLLTVNLVIVILFRINFIFNVIPVSNFNDRNPRVMTQMLMETAGNYPVVFKDMYNEPSYMMFYGHRSSYAFNNIWYKKTQFNYLPELEDSVQGKTVNLVSLEAVNNTSMEISIPKGKKYFVTAIPDFASFNTTVGIDALNFPASINTPAGTVQVKMENHLTDRQKELFKLRKAFLMLTFINAETKESFSTKYDKHLDFSAAAPFTFHFKAPAKKGDYNCVFSIVNSDSFLVGFNSNIYKCKVR